MAEQTIDDDVEKPAETEVSKSKFGLSKKKIIIFGGAGLVAILLGAGAYLYFTGSVDSLLGKKPPPPPAAAPKPLVFYDLPDFLVNLNSGGRKSNFLKLTVSLQIDNPGDQAQLQAVLPRIIDNCQIFLRELRVEDLRGSGGIYRLREELLSRINAVSPVKVDDVLFKEMLVQ